MKLKRLIRTTEPDILGRDILGYEIIYTKDINSDEDIESLIENRRRIYLYNCPREYCHLVDIKEYYKITYYESRLDENNEVLKLLLLNKDRIVLVDSTQVNISKMSKDLVGSIRMENCDDTNYYILFPISDEPDESYYYATQYTSRIITVGMDKGELITKNPKFGELPNLTDRFLYNDDTIAQLVVYEYILLTDESPYYANENEGNEHGVFIRYHDKLYIVEINRTGVGNKVIDFSTMRLVKDMKDEDIFMLGDYVKFEDSDCIIIDVKYGKALLDTMSHVYTIINVKTKSINNVLGYELIHNPKQIMNVYK